MGRHRLLCGDALDPAAYTVLMGGKKADMIFTDSPYNVKIDGHATGLGANRHREFAMASGEMSYTEFQTFLLNACLLLTRHSADGSIHFLCMDWRHSGELLAAARAVYSEHKNTCVWVKSNAGMEVTSYIKTGKDTEPVPIRVLQDTWVVDARGFEWAKYQIEQIEPIRAFVFTMVAAVVGVLAWFGIRGWGRGHGDFES